MTNLPSNALSIKAKSFLTALGVAIITAIIMSILKAAGINTDGTTTLPHIPTVTDFIAALYAGLGAGVAYAFQKYVRNDVPAALETVKDAQQKKADSVLS